MTDWIACLAVTIVTAHPSASLAAAIVTDSEIQPFVDMADVTGIGALVVH